MQDSVDIVNNLNNKLGVYTQYLHSKGFDKLNLDIILRDKVDAINTLDVGGKIILPAELHMFTPIGNPPSFMSAYAVNKDMSYGMIFLSQDTAVNLTMTGKTGQTANPLMFMPTLQEKMGKILAETRDNVDTLEKEFAETPVTLAIDNVVEMDQIDSILYNFLTDRPILIVGPVDEGINILVVFLSLIPEKYQWRFGYSINMPYFSHDSVNFGILDNVPQYDLETEVNTYLEHDHSLVNLYENSSFGDFTCSYTKNIIEALGNGDLTTAKNLVEELYILARAVKAGEGAQAFGDRKQIGYDDADLIVDIASKLEGY